MIRKIANLLWKYHKRINPEKDPIGDIISEILVNHLFTEDYDDIQIFKHLEKKTYLVKILLPYGEYIIFEIEDDTISLLASSSYCVYHLVHGKCLSEDK